MAQTPKSIVYRPEIDGLRAIAVVAVILYHADLDFFGTNLLSGGFLGVDIFFVISGYLITTILVTGFRTGELTLLQFYERRARRILPLLLLVITTSIPLSWLLLLPSEFQAYSWQILSSIFSVSNFYFWGEDSYWATESILKPFLHTWSLGIEEQFYLLLPCLVLVLHKHSQLRLAVVFFALCSLIASQYMSDKDPQSSFYLLPFRAWELFLGASIATLRRGQISNLTLPFSSTLGLATILLCFYFFSENTLHPSFYTLLPTLAVGLVILRADDRDSITKLLQSKILTSVGLISYGLYLWHFPVFSYLSYAGMFHDPSVKVGAIGLIFILSMTTYFFLEKPFRSYSLINSPFFWSVIFVWVLTLSSFSYWGIKDGYSSRVPELVNVPQKPDKIKNHFWFSNQTQTNHRLILVGDSHIASLAPTFKKWSANRGADFAVSIWNGCQLILNMNRVFKADHKPNKHCNVELQNNRIEFLESSQPSIVLIGGRLPLLLHEKRFDNGEGGYEGKMLEYLQDAENSLVSQSDRQAAITDNYKITVQRVIDAGHTVVLMYPVPEVGINVPKTLLKRIDDKYLSARDIVTQDPVTTSHAVFIERTKSSFQLLDSIEDDRVLRIFPSEIFCNSAILGRCITHDSEVSFYRDDDHLSDFGAELVLMEFEKMVFPSGAKSSYSPDR